MPDLSPLRRRMVDTQLARRGIQDRRVMAAMGTVPREAFVAAALDEFAYADAPLPIGEEQTISQPYVVALMIEALALGPGDRVLEIGAGSGYAAAVLGRSRARSTPRAPCLARRAAARALARLGYTMSRSARRRHIGLAASRALRRHLVRPAARKSPWH